MASKEWKLIGHSHQIADTGDYGGYYEITDGDISLRTYDDDDEALQAVVDALNESKATFWIDDWPEIENRLLKEERAKAIAEAVEAERLRIKNLLFGAGRPEGKPI